MHLRGARLVEVAKCALPTAAPALRAARAAQHREIRRLPQLPVGIDVDEVPTGTGISSRVAAAGVQRAGALPPRCAQVGLTEADERVAVRVGNDEDQLPAAVAAVSPPRGLNFSRRKLRETCFRRLP
jgi:hypothetical protein